MKKVLGVSLVGFVFVLTFFVLNNSVFAEPSDYAGGDGSVNNPYQITTCVGLQEIRDSLSSHYILTQNIDCSDTVNWNEGAGFVPIGTNNNGFAGTLNGQGYEISGLTINNPVNNEAAVFGAISSGGIVEYVNFINIDVTEVDTLSAAGLVYDLQTGGIVRYVSVTGNVTAGVVAGIANVVRSGGQVYDSYVLNMTLASRFASAGVALEVRADSSVTRTYAVATHGAIPTYIPEAQLGISAEYSVGSVSNSFYDETVSGDILDGFGTPKTTLEMQTASTFINAGWNFDSVWDIDGSYPFLRAPEIAQPIEFAGGDGSLEDPYQIETCEQLQEIDSDLNAHYILNSDVDCSDTINWNEGAGFVPIAHDGEEIFGGTLDGNGFEITDLFINIPDNSYIGLFSDISVDATISNLGVVDAEVVGVDVVGIIAGLVFGTVENSYTSGEVMGDDDVGGLIGTHAGYDTILDSYSNATVTGDDAIGGLVGSNHGNIYDSYATGDVSGNSNVGGLVGQSEAGDPEIDGTYTQTEIVNSYATGDVYAKDFDFENIDTYILDDEEYESFGGLAGQIHGTIIEDSYATGDVTGYEDIGGLVGSTGFFEYYDNNTEENEFITSAIHDSYATGNVHGTDTVGGFVGDVYASEIYGSYASGDVFGEVITEYESGEFYEQELPDTIGGFVGEIDSYTDWVYNEETETSTLTKVIEGIISESYAYGNVEGNYRVGGFAGRSGSGKFENSYSRGSVTAINEEPESIGGFVGALIVEEGAEMIHVYATGVVTSESEMLDQLGGLVGYVDNDDDLTTSFWDTNISGLTVSAGGTGKTVSQMKTESTFTDAGWDFDSIWSIESALNDGYPILLDHIGEQDDLEGYQGPTEEEPRKSKGSKKKAPSALIQSNQQKPSNTPATNPSSNPGFNRSLQVGSNGLDVKALQQFLNANGFRVSEIGAGSPGNETETFGLATQSALARFQAANGIVPAVGFFGPLTQAFIAAYSPMVSSDVPSNTPVTEPLSVSDTRDLELGMSGSDVSTLQQFLIDAGYTIPAGVTGFFGQQTKDALIKYQEANAITPALGYFGPRTRAQMQSSQLGEA